MAGIMRPTEAPDKMKPTEVTDKNDKAPSATTEETKNPETLEKRYIALLEEKIARLEEEIKRPKKERLDSSADEKEEKVKEDEEGSEEDEDDKDKKGKSRVRYIKRERGEGYFGETTDKVVPEEDIEGAKEKNDSEGSYAIAWRVTATNGDKSTRELLIESKKLRQALKDVLQGDVSVSFDTNEVVFNSPFEAIYHNTPKLQKLADESDDAGTKADVELLLGELEKYQKSERQDATKLLDSGMITYDLLWTLFYPGCQVITEKAFLDQPQVAVVAPQYTYTPLDDSSPKDKYPLVLWSVDFDGTDFKYLKTTASIKSFKGSKAVVDLEVYPLDKWKDPNGKENLEELKQRLINRGELFEKMCRSKLEERFRNYGGPALNEGTVEMLIEGATGGDFDTESNTTYNRVDSGNLEFRRQDDSHNLEDKSPVMIDHYAYFTYGKKDIKLGREVVSHTPCNCTSCLNLRKRAIGEFPSDTNVSTPKKRQKNQRNAKLGLSGAQRLLCPPRVFGFAIRQKVWMQLLVENVKEIDQKDKSEAWDKLQLHKKTKNLLKTLVLQHSEAKNVIPDLIPGKGNGLIVLLHGPPGVGKTLTAESLALLYGKPLYSISMSDVGTSATIVEQNLIQVFELATHWNALLLFDEADVFLEERSLTNLRRNSLVSVLLRILEYFKGILFLTSNRVKTFDEAFQSRIHIAIQYEELTAADRAGIWRLWMEKGREEIDSKTYEKMDNELEGSGGTLSGAKLNGRQIRNVFRSAMAIAQSRGIGERKLTWDDVEQVLKSTVEFATYMLQNKEMATRAGIR